MMRSNLAMLSFSLVVLISARVYADIVLFLHSRGDNIKQIASIKEGQYTGHCSRSERKDEESNWNPKKGKYGDFEDYTTTRTYVKCFIVIDVNVDPHIEVSWEQYAIDSGATYNSFTNIRWFQVDGRGSGYFPDLEDKDDIGRTILHACQYNNYLSFYTKSNEGKLSLKGCNAVRKHLQAAMDNYFTEHKATPKEGAPKAAADPSVEKLGDGFKIYR